MSTTSTITTNYAQYMYSKPELIDVIVTDNTIEHIYKRQLMMSNGFGYPQPEIYKIIFGRHDGSENTVFGRYVEPQEESYEF
jgi:hypothetical protein